jgi:transposase
VHDEKAIRRKFTKLKRAMDERVRRLWAGAEADALGYGGLAAVVRATGLASSTVQQGRREFRAGVSTKDIVNVRRKGGGRKPHEEIYPDLVEKLEALVDPVARGDPESPLRWTCKSTVVLSEEIRLRYGIPVSHQTVARLLRGAGYSLQAPRKTVEGKQHPDRDAQFKYINATAKQCLANIEPFISVDTKKKELVGNFKNQGKEWQPEGAPELVDVHDFPDDAVGKAIPYGVYDVGDNSAYVTVGTDHDTAAFAVASIETWWKRMGAKRYPDARDIFITADSGGSNGYRSRLWKAEIQRLADKIDKSIHVSHFPPGTSKWNKIEHRVFSFITINWRGRPLRTFESVVNLIGSTTTSTGLSVYAKLDERRYPTGIQVPDEVMNEIRIERDEFHGDWNYVIRPRTVAQ